MQAREGMLYPHWEILLTLNKMAKTYGEALKVGAWADTGEVAYMTYSGMV